MSMKPIYLLVCFIPHFHWNILKLLCILIVVVMKIQAAPITTTPASVILPIIMPINSRNDMLHCIPFYCSDAVTSSALVVSLFKHYKMLLNSRDINKYNFAEQYISITFFL